MGEGRAWEVWTGELTRADNDILDEGVIRGGDTYLSAPVRVLPRAKT